MKHSAVTACAIAAIAALLGSACSGLGKPAPRVEYYTLEYPFPAAAAGQKPMPFAIKIRRFQVSPPYNSDKMIYRDKPFARNEYPYRKWRANPGDTAAYLLKRDFQRSARFMAVFSHEDRMIGDYLLEGSVDEFYEQDNPDSCEAVLSLTISLLKENEPDVRRRVVFQKNYQARSPCRQKNPGSFSEAMSRALAQVSQQIIGDVVHALHPACSPPGPAPENSQTRRNP